MRAALCLDCAVAAFSAAAPPCDVGSGNNNMMRRRTALFGLGLGWFERWLAWLWKQASERKASPGRPSLEGIWSDPNSAVVERQGFESLLPEFKGRATPEQEDPAAISLNFVGSQCTVRVGEPCYIEAVLTVTATAPNGEVEAQGQCGGTSIVLNARRQGPRAEGTLIFVSGERQEIRSFEAEPGTELKLSAAYYVDSENGNDANGGTSPDAPLQTIGALPALDGRPVRLARGSRWREYLNAGVGVVESYGCGPRPILDGFDPTPAAIWTLAEGTSHVYQASIDLEGASPAPNSQMQVLQNGWKLHPVADVATCEATPGSFVQRTAQQTPALVHVHLRHGSSPSDDELEVSTRKQGLRLDGSSRARGILCRGGWANEGSYSVVRLADDDSQVSDDMVSLWGSKHNCLLNSGVASRCVMLGIDGGNITGSQFVFYRTAIVGTETTPYLFDCACLNFKNVSQRMTTASSAFYEHDAKGKFFGRTDFNQCGSYNIGKWETQNGNFVDCLAEEHNAVAAAFRIFGTGSLTRCRHYCRDNTDVTFVRSLQDCVAVVATDCIFDSHTPSGGAVLAKGDVTLERCLFRSADRRKYAARSAGALRLSMSHCVVLPLHKAIHLGDEAAELLASDYNVLVGDPDWRESSAAEIRPFSVFQASQTQFDQHSVITAPEYEPGTDATTGRPTFIETATSLAARGFDAGPLPSRPGSGVEWLTPPTYDAWKQFVQLVDEEQSQTLG